MYATGLLRKIGCYSMRLEREASSQDLALGGLIDDKFHGVASDQIDWTLIASLFPDRNNKDCRKRWVYSLSPAIRKGIWDRREDMALREAVQLYGAK